MDFIKTLFDNKNIFLVGEFLTRNSSKNLLSFNWVLSKVYQKDKRGRVYFFIEKKPNGEFNVLKIGKSNDKQGIKGTIEFYVSTLSGTPSITRFSVHHLINEKLLGGSQIFVYCKFSDSVFTKVSGIFNEYEINIPLDVTYIENICLQEYHKHFMKYPEWNFQENNTQIPLKLVENYGIFIQNKKLTRNK